MSSWPVYSITKTPPNHSSRGGKRDKGKEAIRQWQYPVLDHGALTAGTIVEAEGDWEWEWAFVNDPKNGRRVRSLGSSAKIFPAVKALRSGAPDLTLHKRAEQGARFLRTYHPEVDVPFDLIRDELTTDETVNQSRNLFDPFRGNTVESIYCSDGPQKRSIMLAFATGTLGQDLNVSPFVSSRQNLVFEPLAKPLWTFDTPIHHIVSSSPAVYSAEQNADNLLCVRTFGEMTLFSLRTRSSLRSHSDGPPLRLSRMGNVEPTEVDGRPIIDMTFTRALNSTLLVVNDQGAVFTCGFREGGKIFSRVLNSSLDDSQSSFWRIQAGQQEPLAILASGRSVKLYDLRSPVTETPNFNLDDQSNFITSIAIPQSDHTLCISTTSELIWLDDRNFKQPLLAWRHHRSFDRTLTVQTVDSSDASLSFLSSKLTGLITSYGVSRHRSDLLFSCTNPCALPSLTPTPSCSGITIIRRPSENSFNLLGVSEEGSVHSLMVEYVKEPSSDVRRGANLRDRIQRQTHIWSDEVQEMDNKSGSLRPDMGKLAMRESTEVDFSGLYECLFRSTPGSEDAKDERAAEAAYETIDQMPMFWQRSDNDREHLRTLFDVAFASGDDRVQTSRADFLVGTTLHSIRGYRAHKQGRIPTEKIALKSAWHAHLLPMINRISGDIPAELSTTARDLMPYELEMQPDGPPRPAQAMRWESEACEELALDLALGGDVFSSVPIRLNAEERRSVAIVTEEEEAMEPGKILSQVTEALSLGRAPPPPVQFGYFRPIRKNNQKFENKSDEQEEVVMEDEEDEERVELPMGVRHLLSEWKLGTNPNQYVYVDPYDDGPSSSVQPFQVSNHRSSQTTRRTNTQSQSQNVAFQPLRPPVVVAATSIKPPMATIKSSQTHTLQRPPVTPMQHTTMRLPIGGGSQPTQPWDTTTMNSSQSQGFMTNTQVLPGPFGGRPVTKKKPPKRRMGGF